MTDDPVFVFSYAAGDVLSSTREGGHPAVIRLQLSTYSEVDTLQAPPPLHEQIERPTTWWRDAGAGDAISQPR